VIAKEKQKQGQFQPLQFVLDLLQRGQYLTANIADEIETSAKNGTPLGQSTVNVLRAAFQGLTGARKGDWESLLFGGDIQGDTEANKGWLPESFKKTAGEPLIRWGGEGTTGLAEGILRPRKLIGLAANVAMDPTTYLTFGATKAAEAVAARYAEDVVKLTVASMGEAELKKMGVKFAEKVGKNAEDVVKAIQTRGTDIGKRTMESVYNNAYKNALRNPMSKISEDIAPQLQTAISRETPNSGLESIINSISAGIGGEYAAAGQRGFGFLGKNLGVGVRQPWAPTRAWDVIERRFQSAEPGNKLADAWYSVMNKGPVGQIRKAFGIRNPYEQMLNISKRRISDLGIEAASQHEAAMINQAFKPFDQETQDMARNAIVQAESTAENQGVYGALSSAGYTGQAARWTPEERQALVGQYDVLNKLRDPNFQASIGIKPEQIDKVRSLLEKKAEIDRYFTSTENEIAQRVTGSSIVDDRINYFPQLGVGKGEMGGNTIGGAGQIVTGAGGTGFTKGKALTVNERVQNNANMLKFLMGDQLDEAWKASGSKGSLDDFITKFVYDHNLSETTLDLEGAYQLRAIAHAHFMAKYNMIDEFRQFGVPIQDIVNSAPQIQNNLVTFGEGTSTLGLYKVNVPGFENYVFDSSVADTITNVGKLIGNDASTKGVVQMFDRFTNLWKGYAVATPGFTFRNVIQNNLTGFMKNGVRWLDPQTWHASVVGTAYAMDPEKYLDLLARDFKIPNSTAAMFLNKRVGNGDFSLKEIIDWMKSKGTISTRTQAAQEGIAKGAASFNPLSPDFGLFKGARAVNDFAENQAKLHSFLLDYTEMSQGAADLTKPMAERLATQKQYLEYADQETKKWFIDYCFDEKTEILTNDGWKTIDTIAYDQFALSMNMETGKMEWVPIEDIYKNGRNGEMWHIYNQGFDAMVTPNHKWIKLGGTRGGVTHNKPKWMLEETHVTFAKNTRIKLTGDGYVSPPQFFTDDFVELCGWIIAEGTYLKRGESIQVYQSLSHNPKYCERFNILSERLSNMGTIRVYNGTRLKDIITMYIGKGIAEKVRDWLPNKELTFKFLTRLTEYQLELFYKTLLNGDGTITKKGSEIFSQKNEATTKAFQALAMMIGRRSVARWEGNIFRTGIYKKEIGSYTDACNIDVIQYRGRVWCITTKNHTLVARRNGTVYISGNSDLTPFEQKVMKRVIPFYCVPDNAEALTRDGWKKHDEIEIGEEILTYNMERRIQEWQPIEAINKFDFDGGLSYLTGKYGNFRCTDNHKWPVEESMRFVKGKWYGGDTKLVETDKLNTCHLLKLASETDDQESILSARDAALLGWVITDGYFRWRGNHFESMIYQKKDKCVNIIRELGSLNITSESVHPQTGVICFRLSTTWAIKLLQYFKTKEDLPSIVTRLSNKAADAMWTAMMLAEGHYNLTKHFISFAQNIGPVLDAFQILCQILGKPFAYHIHANNGPWSAGKIFTQGYIRNRKNLKYAYIKKVKTYYKGIVWCPTVKNGTWIMRQDGAPIITGNSWLRHNLANQLTGLVTLPETYNLIPKVRNALTDKEGNFNPSLLPDYMKNLGYYPVGKTAQGTNIMRWANIALEDVNKIPIAFNEGKLTGATFTGPEIIQDIFSNAHPLIKTAVELMTGKDTFHRRDIAQYELAAPVFQYLNNAPKVIQFLDGAMRTAGLGEGIRIKPGINGKEVQIDGKVQRILDTNVPALRTLDMLISTPEVLAEQMAPAVEGWVERTFGKKDYYSGLEELFQVISRVGGWKFKEISQDEQAKNKEAELRANLSKAKSQAEKDKVAYDARLAKGKRTTATRNKRLFGAYTGR
jgi:hypothetical protein